MKVKEEAGQAGVRQTMFYVYVLQGKKDKNLYIGRARDLKRRFREHNQGRVPSTKSRRPLILIHYEAYRSEKDAIRREKGLKSGQQRELLQKRISHSMI